MSQFDTNKLKKFAEDAGTQYVDKIEKISADIHPDYLDYCIKELKDTLILSDYTILNCEPMSGNVDKAKKYLRDKESKLGKVIYVPTDIISFKIKSEKNKLNSDKLSDSHLQLRDLIWNAAKLNASDIHIELRPRYDQALIKFRINGELEDYTRRKYAEGVAIHSVAFNVSAEDKSTSFAQSTPQDVSFSEKFDDIGVIRIRSVNVPMDEGGCKIVYRLLSVGQESKVSLSALGYTEEQIQQLKEVQLMTKGIVLFTGPTGSGKTTTLAGILSGIDSRKSTYSIEDPVEKKIPHVVQIPLNTKKKNEGFGFYLRSLLRADPDVIMVGEIRDQETATVSIQGALTGHLILSTLHTNHAINAIARLVDMGVDPKTLAMPSLLRVVVAQRLYQVLCDSCNRTLSTKESEKVSHIYNEEELVTLRTKKLGNKACSLCHGSGIKSRTVFAEMIIVDRKIRELIAQMNIPEIEKYLKNEKNFKSINDQVKAGLIAGKIDAMSIEALELNQSDL